ncbi:MAG: oligosaccharide flippase family protein [Desulfobacterales bacterium]|jgi:O-antigen/teichoic acid export membrane protein
MQPFQSFNLDTFLQRENIKAHIQFFGKEFFLFSLSTILFQASRFMVAMIVARWAGPVEFGVWNSLQPLLAYGVIFFCGIPNGLNREIPFLMGKGATGDVQVLINFSLLFVLCVSSFIGILTFFASFLFDVPESFKSPIRFVALLFVPMNIYMLFQFLLKSRIQFQAMSTQQFLFSFLYPIFTLACAFFAGVSGYIFGQALTALLMVIIIYRISPFPIGLNFSLESFKRLSRIGMPLMGAGLLYILLTTVDRWVILAYLGVKDLGQYTVAILTFGVLSIIPIVISQQMYPRMAYHYGEKGSSLAIIPMIAKQSLAALSVTLPIIIMAYLLVPLFVSSFMPQYSEGILPARILLIGLFFLPLAGGVANFLNTIDKQFYYMIIQAVAVVINFSLATVFVRNGLGLNGVAWAVSISYFLYTLLLSLTGYMIITKKKQDKRDTQMPV